MSGRRVDKSELLLEAYGTVDELNSFVGLVISLINKDRHLDLLHIQNVLFNIGSLLARDGADYPDYPELKMSHIDKLEEMIDSLDESLSALTQFILPSGSTLISNCHICRTVCRRAERRVVALEINDENITSIVMYLNRLSDYFFTLARWCAVDQNIQEVNWDKNV